MSRVVSQIHRNLELVAKLLGDLATGTTIHNNILIAPQYVTMRTELVRALGPFPEARMAVGAVLHQIESEAAESIGNSRQLAA